MLVYVTLQGLEQDRKSKPPLVNSAGVEARWIGIRQSSEEDRPAPTKGETPFGAGADVLQ